MDVERVGPSGPLSSSERKGRKSTPDSEEFKEMMKTGKVGEPEFEKPKKRRSQATEEEESTQLPEPPPRTQPTGPTPFQPSPKINLSKSRANIQPSEESQQEIPPETEETENEKTAQELDSEKKAKEKKKKGFEEVVVTKKEGLIIEKPTLKEDKSKIQKPISTEEKIFIREAPPKTLKEDEKKLAKKIPALPQKEEKEPFLIKGKKLKEEIKEKKEDKEEFKHEISSVLQEMPSNISAQTQSLTAPLTPYLHPDIVPLFEKMVGTIIQIQAQGITTTQVMLNSPAFTSSIFFGSSITLEKYSTAPDSFNIFLRGPQQAVGVFNDNLPSLLDAFKKGNFDFKIGRLEAEHERPLFKRKEKLAGDSDKGSKK